MKPARPTGLLPSTSGIFPMQEGWEICDAPFPLEGLEVEWYWNEQERYDGGRYALTAMDRSLKPPRCTSFEVTPAMVADPRGPGFLAQLARGRLSTLDRTTLGSM